MKANQQAFGKTLSMAAMLLSATAAAECFGDASSLAFNRNDWTH
ncbi:hypothetical protein THAOC_13860, partial [Thalassiosira oceanica]